MSLEDRSGGDIASRASAENLARRGFGGGAGAATHRLGCETPDLGWHEGLLEERKSGFLDEAPDIAAEHVAGDKDQPAGELRLQVPEVPVEGKAVHVGHVD